jgi:hypothetical protein
MYDYLITRKLKLAFQKITVFKVKILYLFLCIFILLNRFKYLKLLKSDNINIITKTNNDKFYTHQQLIIKLFF